MKRKGMLSDFLPFRQIRWDGYVRFNEVVGFYCVFATLLCINFGKYIKIMVNSMLIIFDNYDFI